MPQHLRVLRRIRGALLALLVGLTLSSPAVAERVAGIDVSHYQGEIDWPAVKKSGIVFAIAKATEGTEFKDKVFQQNIAGMKRVGIIPGAYHFARPGGDPTAEADHFTSVVKKANGGNYSGMLQLVLDLEKTDGKSPAQVAAWTKTFVARCKAETGRPCIIYTGYYFWRDKVGDPKNNFDCPLWLAAYVSEKRAATLVPRAWSGVGWAFWQYTSKGSVPGIRNNVDRDLFQNGGNYPKLENLRIP